MPILIALALAVQVLRLINNLLEGVPVELRRAQAIVWADATVNLLPVKYRPAIEKAIATLKEGKS